MRLLRANARPLATRISQFKHHSSKRKASTLKFRSNFELGGKEMDPSDIDVDALFSNFRAIAKSPSSSQGLKKKRITLRKMAPLPPIQPINVKDSPQSLVLPLFRVTQPPELEKGKRVQCFNDRLNVSKPILGNSMAMDGFFYMLSIGLDEDMLDELCKGVDTLTLANLKLVKSMSFIQYFMVRQLERLKNDLKVEK